MLLCSKRCIYIFNSKSKNILFKNNQLYWIDLFKGTETRLYPCRPQPVTHHLPFKILYTNIAALWLHRHSMISKPAQLVYIYDLNGKGSLTSCGPHGTILVSILFLHFAHVQVFLFVLFCFCIIYSSRLHQV